MKKVAVYIDGFNLYFGMNEKFGKKYLWLDIVSFAQKLIQADQELACVKYFTSRVRNNPPKELRQKEYLEALETYTSAELIYGHFQSNSIDCRRCGANWPAPNEKMTDVNIDTHLIIDAYKEVYDTAIVVSGDSDLVPPIKAVLENFPHKKVGVLFPPDRHSHMLQNIASFHAPIGKKKLKDSQMPNQIIKTDGYILNKPATWR